MNTALKKIGVFLAVVAIVAALVASFLFLNQGEKRPQPDLKKAPEWTLRDLDGNTVSSAEFAGKVVVIDFWATWCPPCRKEIPGYIQLEKAYSEKGLVIIGVSVDDGPEIVKEFAQKSGVNYKMLMADEKITKDFGGIEAIPTTFVIDREGQIRFSKRGYMANAEFEKQIKPLL